MGRHREQGWCLTPPPLSLFEFSSSRCSIFFLMTFSYKLFCVGFSYVKICVTGWSRPIYREWSLPWLLRIITHDSSSSCSTYGLIQDLYNVVTSWHNHYNRATHPCLLGNARFMWPGGHWACVLSPFRMTATVSPISGVFNWWTKVWIWIWNASWPEAADLLSWMLWRKVVCN